MGGGILPPIHQDSDEKASESAAVIISFLQSSDFSNVLECEKASTPEGLSTERKVINGVYTQDVTFDEYPVAEKNLVINEGHLRLVYNAEQSTAGISGIRMAQRSGGTTEIPVVSFDIEVIETLKYAVDGLSHTFQTSVQAAPFPLETKIEVNETDGAFDFTEDSTPVISLPADSLVTVDNTDVIVGETADQVTDWFGGGTGTAEDPYRIYNADQFAYISTLSKKMAESADAYYYFKVYDDIELYEGMRSPIIPVFRGELDFQGHELSGVTESILSENCTDEQETLLTSSQYAWTDTGNLIGALLDSAIRNLEYKPDEYLPITVYGNWFGSNTAMVRNENAKIIFENVSVYGDFDELGSNASLFISQVFNAALEMTGCVNNADMDYLTYGAPFLGGYLENSTATFTDCVNNGDIVGNWASIFIGNRTIMTKNLEDDAITVQNCSNNGSVVGFEYVGYYLPVSSDENLEEYSWFNSDTVGSNSGEELVYFAGDSEPSGVDVRKNDEGVFVITNTNSRYSSFKLMGTTYAVMLNGSGETQGTYLIRVVADDIVANSNETPVETGFHDYDIIDSTNGDTTGREVTDDSFGNAIVTTADGITYYYNDSYISENIKYIVGYNNGLTASLTYYLYCYDSKGDIVAIDKLAL